MTSPTFFSRRLLLAFGLAAACILVYFPGLSGGFLFDDFPNIVSNPRVHMESLDWESLSRAAQAYAPGLYGRPLATLGFGFDFYLGAKDPWGYKLHSLAAHAANCLLVFALLTRLFALPAAGGRWPTWAAAVIALMWAVHPMQVSTVLYVVQRMEMLSVTFVLLALLAYLRGRIAQRDGRPGWHWLVAAGALAALGMLSKETAILLPVFALSLELTLLRFKASRPATRRFLMIAYAGSILISVVVFLAFLLPPQLAPEAYAYRGFTLGERLLTQLRVLPMYLGQMLLPLPDSLPFYYDDYQKSTGLLSPATTLAGALLLASLLAVAAVLRHRAPLVALGIFWFFASHLLTSNVIALELAFEHRNYFALLGVLLAIVGLLRMLPMDGISRVATIGVAVLLVGFAGLSAVRAATWGHPLVLATDLVAKNPTSPRASSDLATLYIGYSDSDPGSPYFELGKREFERGAKLPNASPLPEQGLILMAATTGQPVDDAWWDSLIRKLRDRPIGPQEAMAVAGLLTQRNEGIALDDRRLAEAYEVLLGRGGASVALYLQYAEFAFTHLDDRALATRIYSESMQARGISPEYAARIIAALVMDGRGDIADAVEARARELGLLTQ